MELSNEYTGSSSDSAWLEEEAKEEYCYKTSHQAKICAKVKNNCLFIETDVKFLHSIQIFKIFSNNIFESDCNIFVAYNVDDCFASDKEIKTLFIKDFLSDLSEILVSNGFSRYASEEIIPAEWALQQMGRARYEAKEVIQEIRNAVTIDNVEI